MDAGTVDNALAASVVAERRNRGAVLAEVAVAVRMLSLSQLSADERSKWDSAVANQQVTIAHPDADPTGAGVPVDVVRVIADWDGIQVVVRVEGA